MGLHPFAQPAASRVESTLAVADYRLSAQIISRRQGRSSVAASAYRAGASLTDERTGIDHDFTRKGGVEDSWIEAPPEAPSWATDRGALWNAVESAERRSDAQVAREVQLSLPHELTFDQRKALVAEFVQQEFVAKGMVADVAMHKPSRGGDHRNFHAHIMLTTREIGPDGFGKKAREWNSAQQLAQWREAWAETQNRHLARALGERAPKVSHLSLRDQDVDRLATRHLGPTATEMERRGAPSMLGDRNRAIRDRNALVTEYRRRQAEIAAAVVPPGARALAEIETEMRVKSKGAGQQLLEARNDLSRIMEQRKEIKVETRRNIESEVLGDARKRTAAALRELRTAEAQVARVQKKRHSLVTWIMHPQRVIFSKIREGMALSRANQKYQTERLKLVQREQWLRSAEGKDYVAARLLESRKPLNELRTAERRARRQIAQAERALRQMKFIEQRAVLLRTAGLRSVEAPARAVQEKRYLADLGRSIEGSYRTVPAPQLARARQLLAQSKERGR